MSEPEPPPADPTPAPPLAEGINVVAELFRLGAHRNGSLELSRVWAEATDEERRTVMRVEATLQTYPWVIARARLQAAARDNPHLGELIRACIPVTDPRVYRPSTASTSIPPAPTPAPHPTLDVSQLQWTTPADPIEQRALRRILKTLEQYPFPEAQRRLRAAARDRPELSDFILRHLPETDPGLHHPDDAAHGQVQRWNPQRKTRSRIDPSRRIPADQQRGVSRIVEDYFAEQPDRYLTQQADDDRTRDDEYFEPTTPPATAEVGAVEGTRLARSTDTDHGQGNRQPDAAADHAGSRKAPRPARVSGSRREYDGGQFEPNVENLRGLSCVACLLERPVADTSVVHSAQRHTADDGLCTDCRDAGHPGIPAHDAGDHIRARCQFIADTHPPEQARALLRRDFRNSPVLAVRIAIAEWTHTNLPVPPAAPAAPENAVAQPNPLLKLTDTALDELARDLHQRIALADTDTLLSSELDQVGAADTTPAADLQQMQTAITTARKAQSAHRVTSAQLQAARSAVRDARDRIEATPRLARSERRRLEIELKGLTSESEKLQTQVDHARRAARAAVRDAILHAGPEAGWDRILQRHDPSTGHSTAEADQVERLRRSEHAREQTEQLKARWQHDLDTVRAEQHRRSHLTPPQREHEQQLRDQIATETASLTEAGSAADQTHAEVDNPDVGL
ncbi:hypothetical protein [Nocardia nova]|nr:hypothetical protein [Nocardia nova]